jgi:spermidine synthase
MAQRRRQATQVEVDSGVAELVADPDRPRAFTLRLDGVPQSHVDLDDPRYLDFEYVRRMAHVVDLLAPPGAPLRVLHLGGGALTLARYIAATRPRSGQQVVEIDAGLIELVRRELPLERGRRIRIRNGDAREILEKAPASAFDLVIADAFAAGRTPAHLASTGFAALAARALRPDGVYVANIADGAPLAFARAQVATVRTALPHAMLLAEPGVLRGRRFGNLVLVAARHDPPVDPAALTRRAASDPFASRLLEGRELTDFTAGAAPFTDETARPSQTPPAGLFQ